MLVLDTNAVLRYILGDNLEMAQETKERILSNDTLIPIEVAAEIVYVLSSVYKIERNKIQTFIQDLLQIRHINTPNDNLITCAIDCYANSSLDFVDCLMTGYQQVCGHEIFTFDKQLKRLLSRYNRI